MGRGCAQGLVPLGLGVGLGAAVDDQPVLTDAHLEAQRPGVNAVITCGKGDAGVHEYQRPPGGETLEPGMRGAGDRPALGPGLGQDHVDEAFVFLVAVVEKRQAPIAVAEAPEHGRHAVDGTLQIDGDLDAGRLQACTDIHQMAQDGELERRVALKMTAVRQNLVLDLPVQEPEAGVEAILKTGKVDTAIH